MTQRMHSEQSKSKRLAF